MGNISNLIPNSQRTAEQRRINAIKAGKASAASRRARKAFKEGLIDLLSLPMKKGRVKTDISAFAEFKDANVTVNQRILLALAAKAAKGDVKAAEFIRDTIGEAPVQEVRMEQTAVSRLSEEELRRIADGRE